MQGLAWHNGKLYIVGAVGADTDGIFTVDTDTGVADACSAAAGPGCGRSISRPGTAREPPQRL